MRRIAVMIAALALAGCGPFVNAPAPTLADPPTVSNTVAKSDKAVKVPLPKPRPVRVIKKRNPVVPYETKTLGYSCATVRWANSAFSREFIDNQSVAQGVTPAQKAEAARCLKP